MRLNFSFSSVMHVLAFCDPEIIVRIVSLRDTVGGSGGADCQSVGGTLRSLRLSNSNLYVKLVRAISSLASMRIGYGHMSRLAELQKGPCLGFIREGWGVD